MGTIAAHVDYATFVWTIISNRAGESIRVEYDTVQQLLLLFANNPDERPGFDTDNAEVLADIDALIQALQQAKLKITELESPTW